MEQERISDGFSGGAGYKFELPMKLPSLNEYINACRGNAYAGAQMKKRCQRDISWFLRDVPKFDGAVEVHFHWVEENRRRDLDNVAFAKKFILDAMVSAGVLKDDSRRYVAGFTDTFGYGKEAKVVVEIKNT